jgi:hypothetical protein
MNWFNGLLRVFRDAGYAALITTALTSVISVAALIISIVSLRSSNRTSRRLIEIEEGRDRLASKQAAKAKITSMLNRQGSSYRLTIFNEANGEAREIRVTLDGIGIVGNPAVLRGQAEKRRLGPRSSFYYNLVVSQSFPKPKTIRIEWQDDSGEAGLYESDL